MVKEVGWMFVISKAGQIPVNSMLVNSRYEYPATLNSGLLNTGDYKISRYVSI